MSGRMRTLIAAVGLAMAAGGCDRGWRMFEQVKLGQVLGPQSLLRPRQSKGGTTRPAADAKVGELLVWADTGICPVPLSRGVHAVAARTDGEGRVTARSYRAQVFSHYALFTAAAMRRVVELRAPARMLLKPTARTKDDQMLVGTGKARTLRGYLINAMHEVDGYPYWEPGLFHVLLVATAGETFGAAMSMHSSFHSIERSIKRLPLEGIAQEGYDRTFQPVQCGNIRIQNLGRQRIRIEINLFRLYDPLGLAAYAYAPSE